MIPERRVREAEVGWPSADTIKFYFRKRFGADVFARMERRGRTALVRARPLLFFLESRGRLLAWRIWQDGLRDIIESR
jgi:hypothetical protein